MKELRKAKVAVIGGAGLIGSHLVDQLRQEEVAEIRVYDNLYRGSRENLEQSLKDPRVRLMEGDILKVKDLRAALEGVDYVFHLAAAWLLECLEKPRLAVDVNVMGTFNVLEACRDLGIQRLIFSSSASVYGNAVTIPMREDHPFNNRTLYGATKIAGEQLCRAFHEMYRLNYVGLRYMNVYGPRQDYKSAYTVVIMKILDRIDQGLPPLIYGDGSQSYDFIYVEDAAAANLCALKADAVDEFYNVGMGVMTSINELTHLLLEMTGSSLKPQYEPAGMTFVTNRVGSTEKAARDLRFRARMGLREGLEKLIAWRSLQKGKS
ncbi:MAG: NAD-dependent epimerase/dehydratase family protein [candidate division NC10 bacterium]|nr:NAD-dependent epimerase/dehydratase family protein [candidate division NC10 bacterium]